MKTSELTGALLDYWVGKAGGLDVSGQPMVEVRDRFGNWSGYAPSSNWAQGGPIIEREQMYLEWDADGYWVAAGKTTAHVRADTPLVAAMRAYVASKFGETVPDDPA